jgi:hypothetical protein
MRFIAATALLTIFTEDGMLMFVNVAQGCGWASLVALLFINGLIFGKF